MRRTEVHHRRFLLIFSLFALAFLAVVVRLAYWQLWRSQDLTALAEAQYNQVVTQEGKRGNIYFSQGEPLVVNARRYELFAQPRFMVTQEKETLVASLAAILVDEVVASQTATQRGRIDRPHLLQELTLQIKEKLFSDKKWLTLFTGLGEESKTAIERLGVKELGFTPTLVRHYPEASVAAQLLGFLGKNATGQAVGYFGLEGGWEDELKPRAERHSILADALGNAFQSDRDQLNSLDGRDLTLTLRRDIQRLAESSLRRGLNRYGATAGEIIIMEPTSGSILAMASAPSYEPAFYHQAEPERFRNPSLADLYEPGSTFKVLTVATGLDTGVVGPETECPICAGPRTFGQYQIKTWDERYHPNITVREALAKSDNTAMIFIAEKVGAERFRQYLTRFGIGVPLDLGLEGVANAPLSTSWRPVELATTSFGQGVVTTSLQLTKAIAAIANRGVVMKPRLVDSIYDPLTDQRLQTPIVAEGEAVSTATAATMTELMQYAAQKGEAQWTYRANHSVAGKTGTSQVAVPGGYQTDMTIASFIGFAPAQAPRFVMLVKLVDPESSPWAAETAAPLWYDVAEQLYLLMDIPPDRV